LLPATAVHAQPQDRLDNSGTLRATHPSERRAPRPLRQEGSGCPARTRCFFRVDGLVRVTYRYRFQREIHDKPDWQALDLRVLEWIAARTVTEAPR
jgi:hypothetical protein